MFKRRNYDYYTQDAFALRMAGQDFGRKDALAAWQHAKTTTCDRYLIRAALLSGPSVVIGMDYFFLNLGMLKGVSWLVSKSGGINTDTVTHVGAAFYASTVAAWAYNGAMRLYSSRQTSSKAFCDSAEREMKKAKAWEEIAKQIKSEPDAQASFPQLRPRTTRLNNNDNLH